MSKEKDDNEMMMMMMMMMVIVVVLLMRRRMVMTMMMVVVLKSNSCDNFELGHLNNFYWEKETGYVREFVQIQFISLRHTKLTNY